MQHTPLRYALFVYELCILFVPNMTLPPLNASGEFEF